MLTLTIKIQTNRLVLVLEIQRNTNTHTFDVSRHSTKGDELQNEISSILRRRIFPPAQMLALKIKPENKELRQISG